MLLLVAQVVRHRLEVKFSVVGVSCVRAAERGSQQWNDRRIVVRDGVDVVEREIARIVEIVLRFLAREESPPTIAAAAGLLPVHKADAFAFNGDVIRCKAVAVTSGELANLGSIKAETLVHG